MVDSMSTVFCVCLVSLMTAEGAQIRNLGNAPID
jgi:hypothetical protein